MSEMTGELQLLHRQLARRRKLDLMLEDLRSQLTELEDEETFLHEAYLAEEEGVQRGGDESFSALLERLLRRVEQHRTVSEAELCAAAMKAECTARQLSDVQAHLAALLREKERYAGAEAALTAAFQAQRQRLAATGPQRAAELLALEQRIAATEAELREVEEAQVAGARVLAAVENAARRLSGAEGWGGVDLLSSGPHTVAAAFAGRSGSVPVENGVYAMQEMLRSYRTELADVELEAGLRMKVDGFLRFADGVFDDLFAASSAWDPVRGAEQRLADAAEQVQAVQDHLAASQERYCAEAARLREQRQRLAEQD